MRVTVALLAVVAAGVWAAPASAAPAPSPDRTVTLISGDRIRVAPDGRSASRAPSPGRESVTLVTQYAGGRLRVIPADAVPLLAADRLDPRLFDVTTLVSDGFADRDELPLIVTADRPAAVAAAAGGPVRELDTIGGVAIRVSRTGAPGLWRDLTVGTLRTAYRKVWLDGIARLGVDGSVPLVGAPAAWAAGYSGAGVSVGVLDTGVDAGHPDLAGAVAESADFTGEGDGVDRVGHGTHVASVLAGSGAASNGRFRGMAPEARVYSGKVCAAETCAESAVLAGMQWAARDKALKVVNVSVGRPAEAGGDLLEAAATTLTERFGTLFVGAAGNDHGRLWAPASAPAAIAVGAGDDGDATAEFSNVDPDLVAPGVGITAARSGDSGLPSAGTGKSAYATLSGTSMAAPHVTGAAALLAQQHPDWSAARIKDSLLSSATPLAPRTRSGAGRLDMAQAMASPVLAEPARLTLTGAGSREVTYRNFGSAPLDLVLTTSSADFAVDAGTLTVPANGEASARVSAGAGDTARSGTLTAAVGDLTVHTVLTAPARTFRLTPRATDRAGAPTERVFAAAYDARGRAWTDRVPPGVYTVDAKVFEADGGVTLLTLPRVTVTGDTTVDLDARAGRPVRVTAPGRPVHAQVTVAMPGGASAGLLGQSFTGVTTAGAGVGAEMAATFAGPDWLASAAWPLATGVPRSVRLDRLTKTRAEFGGTGNGTMTRIPAGGGGWTTEFTLPHQRTEYFDDESGWRSAFTAGSRLMTGAPTTPTDRWNQGLYGPAFPPGSSADLPAFTTDATHDGPAPGPVERTGDRLTVGGSTWSLPRGDAAGALSAVRFEPRSADRPGFPVLGFAVQHRVPGTTTTTLDLRVSYDEGRTWQEPLYSRVGDRGVVVLRPGGGEVSLRVTARNSAGSSVTQTMSKVWPR